MNTPIFYYSVESKVFTHNQNPLFTMKDTDPQFTLAEYQALMNPPQGKMMSFIDGIPKLADIPPYVEPTEISPSLQEQITALQTQVNALQEQINAK